MRFFYDTEFLENGKTIDLISFGIVSEDGREYYAVNSEAPWDRIAKHQWLCENVVPHLPLKGNKRTLRSVVDRTKWVFSIDETDVRVKPRQVIANEVRHFFTEGNESEPAELWGYYSAYDHVVLAQLWGTMMKLPTGIPKWTNDLKQAAYQLGVDTNELPEQIGTEHNALDDARWVRSAWLHLQEHSKEAR